MPGPPRPRGRPGVAQPMRSVSIWVPISTADPLYRLALKHGVSTLSVIRKFIAQEVRRLDAKAVDRPPSRDPGVTAESFTGR